MPFDSMVSILAGFLVVSVFSKTPRPSSGKMLNMSSKKLSMSAVSASDRVGWSGSWLLSILLCFAALASSRSRDSRCWTWALFKLMSFDTKNTAQSQKSFFP